MVRIYEETFDGCLVWFESLAAYERFYHTGDATWKVYRSHQGYSGIVWTEKQRRPAGTRIPLEEAIPIGEYVALRNQRAQAAENRKAEKKERKIPFCFKPPPGAFSKVKFFDSFVKSCEFLSASEKYEIAGKLEKFQHESNWFNFNKQKQ